MFKLDTIDLNSYFYIIEHEVKFPSEKLENGKYKYQKNKTHTIIHAPDEETAFNYWKEYSKDKDWICFNEEDADSIRGLNILSSSDFSEEPRIISSGQFLSIVYENLLLYREKAQKSIHNNNHMNDINKNEKINQKHIDAILIDFLNFLGGQFGVNYGLHTKDIVK